MKKLFLPALIFLASGAYYGFQACPTFYYWDSAELTAAVIASGVPHPPGFPLLLILARIWVAVIPLNASGSLNLFSSFFAALGLSVWFAVIAGILKKSTSGKNQGAVYLFSLVSTLVMGISLTYGIQGTRLEVYSLNFACFAVLVLLAFKMSSADQVSHRHYYILFALIGLAMGAHVLTIALAIPGILLIVYLSRRMNLRRIAYGIALASLITIPQYFIIYYLAQHHPSLNWGDPSSLKSFYDYVFIREFTVSASSFSPGNIIENLMFVVRLLANQLGVPGLVLSVWGFIHLVREKPAIAVPLAAILFMNSFSTIFSEESFLENYDLNGYLMISLAIVILLAAVGLMRLHNSIAGFLKKSSSGRSGNIALVVTMVLSILIFAYPVKRNIFSADLSDMRGARLYAERFLESAPDDALIVTSYYNTYFCLLAYNACESSQDIHSILNVYNWDHEWGKKEINRRYRRELPIDIDRQSFYRHFLNEFMRKIPIYVEYDEASAPLAKYLKPKGLGYLFTTTETSLAEIGAITDEIEARLAEASESEHMESIKTWVLWFQNRGLYYKHRGHPEASGAYFSAVDSVAALLHVD
jgi:hypothetical protein